MLKKLIAALLIISMPVFATAPGGDLYKSTPISQLYEFAKKEGGFGKMCAESAHQCPQPKVLITPEFDDELYGMYNAFERTDTVIVSMGNLVPGSVAWNATLVHEFTHYLQWLDGQYSPKGLSCSMMYNIEIGAYRTMAKYYDSVDVKYDLASDEANMSFNAAMCAAGGG